MKRTPGDLVLVVDDEEIVRSVVRDILEEGGIEVLEAANGNEALERLMSPGERTPLILLDLTLPDASGEEVLDKIRELRPEARIILMSGYSEGEVRERLPDEKAPLFLQKPFTPQTLLETIASVP